MIYETSHAHTGAKSQAYFADQGSRNWWNLMMAFNDMLQKELNKGCYRCDLLEIFLIPYAGGNTPPHPKIQRYRIGLKKCKLSQKIDFRSSLSGKVWYCNKFLFEWPSCNGHKKHQKSH